jgi:K+-sensing histidine kinase KdpD
VTDNGVGIAPDQQTVVFEEFRHASGDLLGKSEGKGLDLTLAKRCVELHGASMRLTSAPGKGSIFAFTCQTAPWGLLDQSSDRTCALCDAVRPSGAAIMQ